MQCRCRQHNVIQVINNLFHYENHFITWRQDSGRCNLAWIPPEPRVICCLREYVHHCGLVVSAPACVGTGCEFDPWQCRIYIPCSLSLQLLGSLRGSLGTNGLTQKLCKNTFVNQKPVPFPALSNQLIKKIVIITKIILYMVFR